jgi:hypothetical protein
VELVAPSGPVNTPWSIGRRIVDSCSGLRHCLFFAQPQPGRTSTSQSSDVAAKFASHCPDPQVRNWPANFNVMSLQAQFSAPPVWYSITRV